MKTAIPVISNKRVFYSAKKYLKYLKENINTIEQVRIVPPKIGKKGWGYIEIETKNAYGNL
jgi:hypothetical protein